MGEAYSNLDLALKETGHFESAVQVHKKAMELSRTDVGTLTNYGSALQAAAKTESAIATFERALFADPRQHGRQNGPGDCADGLIGSQSRDRHFRRVIAMVTHWVTNCRSTRLLTKVLDYRYSS